MGFENVNEQEILARIRRLSRDDATGAGNPPGSPLQPLGEQTLELLTRMQESQNPTQVPPGTRMRLYKRIVQRVMRTFTQRQVEFNYASRQVSDAVVKKVQDILGFTDVLARRTGDMETQLENANSRLAGMEETLKTIGESLGHITEENRALRARIEEQQQATEKHFEDFLKRVQLQVLQNLKNIHQRIDDEKISLYTSLESVQSELRAKIVESAQAQQQQNTIFLQEIHQRINDEKSSLYTALESIQSELQAKITKSDQTQQQQNEGFLREIHRRIDDEKNSFYGSLESVKTTLQEEIGKTCLAHENNLGKSISEIHKRIEDEKKGLLVVFPDHDTLNHKTAEAKSHADRLGAILDSRIKEIQEILTPDGILALHDAGESIGNDIYLNLEECFRGTEEYITNNQSAHGDLIEEHHKNLKTREGCYLDVGCGRGELLRLLNERNIPSEGVDSNDTMVQRCRSEGLVCHLGNGITHLEGLPEASLRGIMAIQVIEHLRTREMLKFFQLAHRKLQPGGLLLLETVNPESVYALRLFYLDYTHKMPLPAPLVKFFVHQAGFSDVEIIPRSPVEGWRQMSVTGENEIMDGNFHKLNNFLFGFGDYAVKAIR